MFLVVINIAMATTNITHCQYLSSAGKYILENNLTNTSTCLRLNSSNIELDCESHGICDNGFALDENNTDNYPLSDEYSVGADPVRILFGEDGGLVFRESGKIILTDT